MSCTKDRTYDYLYFTVKSSLLEITIFKRTYCTRWTSHNCIFDWEWLALVRPFDGAYSYAKVSNALRMRSKRLCRCDWHLCTSCVLLAIHFIGIVRKCICMHRKQLFCYHSVASFSLVANLPLVWRSLSNFLINNKCDIEIIYLNTIIVYSGLVVVVGTLFRVGHLLAQFTVNLLLLLHNDCNAT